jgi:hypothetical protein
MSGGKSILPEWWYRQFLAELPERNILILDSKTEDATDGTRLD